jgi:hypothetical protein
MSKNAQESNNKRTVNIDNTGMPGIPDKEKEPR